MAIHVIHPPARKSAFDRAPLVLGCLCLVVAAILSVTIR
ncbi:hypothetical protein ABIE44_002366 [Marmoricola sp. OAE513]